MQNNASKIIIRYIFVWDSEIHLRAKIRGLGLAIGRDLFFDRESCPLGGILLSHTHNEWLY